MAKEKLEPGMATHVEAIPPGYATREEIEDVVNNMVPLDDEVFQPMMDDDSEVAKELLSVFYDDLGTIKNIQVQCSLRSGKKTLWDTKSKSAVLDVLVLLRDRTVHCIEAQKSDCDIPEKLFRYLCQLGSRSCTAGKRNRTAPGHILMLCRSVPWMEDDEFMKVYRVFSSGPMDAHWDVTVVDLTSALRLDGNGKPVIFFSRHVASRRICGILTSEKHSGKSLKKRRVMKRCAILFRN